MVSTRSSLYINALFAIQFKTGWLWKLSTRDARARMIVVMAGIQSEGVLSQCCARQPMCICEDGVGWGMRREDHCLCVLFSSIFNRSLVAIVDDRCNNEIIVSFGGGREKSRKNMETDTGLAFLVGDRHLWYSSPSHRENALELRIVIDLYRLQDHSQCDCWVTRILEFVYAVEVVLKDCFHT